MRKRLLSLYPEAYRDRYGEEMAALLDDTAPSIAGMLDLLRGALVAHLRPVVATTSGARARVTIAYVLGCFIAFCFLGAGFAKTTENYDYTEHLHPLLGVSHRVILVAAILAGVALALAAAPLAFASVSQALRTRDPNLFKLIAIPPGAIASLAGSVGLLVLWLDAHHHRPGVGGWLLLGVCGVCAAIAGVACWAAPRAIMRRIELPRGVLRFAVPAVGVVALCMVAVAIAVGSFLGGIVVDAPQLGSSGNGPGQLIDVTSSIAIQFAGMLALSAGAMLSASRGLRSVRSL